MTADEIIEIKDEIATLPTGGITYKTINGKSYAYYQWTENGKQHSRRVKDSEINELSVQICRRKELKSLIDGEKIPLDYVVREPEPYRCYVRIGKLLDNYVKPVGNYKKRNCYNFLENYIYDQNCEKVFILFGLRRTGKTTMIRQAIGEMSAENRELTAFVQIREGETLADLNFDMKILEREGFKYIFIDEITLLEDFIGGAALLSDIYAASGMKIVLSGTDSLGFVFAENDELYGRCILCHTTFIPYGEFENVLGVSGVDNYIMYGGTMIMGGESYNGFVFENNKTTGAYVDSAIATNIQHSLKNYQYGGHFRSLRELYENNELTNVINRVVEDINHRFALDVLTKDFKSSELSISAKNLRKDRNNPTDILDRVDAKKITAELMKLLEIKNSDELKAKIKDAHRIEIKEYLDLLDLTEEIELRKMTDFNDIEKRTVFSQPGLRYSQAKALIETLMKDNLFRNLSITDRNFVIERITGEIKGRMLEDIILLETKKAKKKAEIFKLQFAVGEFDMVVFYPESSTCELYEIKHSDKMIAEQCKYLLNDSLCADVEFRYGEITEKFVIYRGISSVDMNGVRYINAEDYLKSLLYN